MSERCRFGLTLFVVGYSATVLIVGSWCGMAAVEGHWISVPWIALALLVGDLGRSWLR